MKERQWRVINAKVVGSELTLTVELPEKEAGRSPDEVEREALEYASAVFSEKDLSVRKERARRLWQTAVAAADPKRLLDVQREED